MEIALELATLPVAGLTSRLRELASTPPDFFHAASSSAFSNASSATAPAACSLVSREWRRNGPLMTLVRHQTIRLSGGGGGFGSDSPDEGACVMELASMLAGEEFSDQPVSVCPVIGAFLRKHNDSIDDERQQDVYAYAAKVGR